MNQEFFSVKSVLSVVLLSFGLLACSMPAKILPNAKLNVLMVAADNAIHDGNWDVALTQLDQAAKIQPNNLDVKLKQGIAYQLSGKLALAHNAYQQVIDAQSNPVGRNVEIVRAARTNQAKLGFKNTVLIETPGIAAGETPSAGTALVTSAPELSPASKKEFIAEIEAINGSENQAVLTTESNETEMITAQIDAWRTSWQEKRIRDYLSSYVADFSGDFPDHEAWQQQRTARISAAENINIQISNLRIDQPDATSAVVTFTQAYQTATHIDSGLKTLQFRKVNGRWVIIQEQFSK